MPSHLHPISIPYSKEDTIVSNTISVNARVAAFRKTAAGYLFLGHVDHAEAGKGRNLVYLPMSRANTLADRAARRNGERALDIRANETLIPTDLFSTKDVVRATFKTGAGVEDLREQYRIEAKRGRAALKAIRAVKDTVGF